MWTRAKRGSKPKRGAVPGTPWPNEGTSGPPRSRNSEGQGTSVTPESPVPRVEDLHVIKLNLLKRTKTIFLCLTLLLLWFNLRSPWMFVSHKLTLLIFYHVHHDKFWWYYQNKICKWCFMIYILMIVLWATFRLKAKQLIYTHLYPCAPWYHKW